MLKHALLAAMVCSLPLCCGCVVAGVLPPTRFAFELRFEDDTNPSEQERTYVVFSEEWHIITRTEANSSSWLHRARMSYESSTTLEFTVPFRPGISFLGIPCWNVTTMLPEHTFTVFSPGCLAATVYPLGCDGVPPKSHEPQHINDGPGLIDTGDPPDHADPCYVNVPLGYSKKADGVFHTVLPLKRLPPMGSKEQSWLFLYQLWSLANAINEKHLDSVDLPTRQLVYEAVREQHICCEQAIDSESGLYGRKALAKEPLFDVCVKREDDPCGVIARWATP